jgi:hypothetical protein
MYRTEEVGERGSNSRRHYLLSVRDFVMAADFVKANCVRGVT